MDIGQTGQPMEITEHIGGVGEVVLPVPLASRHPGIDAVIDFIGGCAGGTASVYVGQPLDTVKVKMQTFPDVYKNAMDCFVKTYKQDGIARGLYAGTLPSLAANIAENSILFCFYGVCQKSVASLSGVSNVKDLHPVQNALAGSGAAVFSSFSLCPTELVKCRLQAMREMATLGQLEGGLDKLKIGPVGLTREILRAEGIRGLFKGFTSTCMREVPGYFFFFGSYEITRKLLTPPGKTKDEIGVLRTIISGGVGGVCLWTIIFPADVIKSRIQVQSVIGSKAPTFLATVTEVYRIEGLRALYKGLGPTLLRTFPATGALFLAYETTKKWMSVGADQFF